MGSFARACMVGVLACAGCFDVSYQSANGDGATPPDSGAPDAGTDSNVGFCGDGVAGGAEECDGTDLAGSSCSLLGLGMGTLTCTAACTIDLSGCDACGNGVIEGAEQCDGTALGGEDCVTRGFTEG